MSWQPDEAIKSPGLLAAMDSAESGIGDLDGLLEQVGCGGGQGLKPRRPCACQPRPDLSA
jgi:hypothetical protein